MASGGTINQILIKNSNTNYDTTWVNYIPTGGTQGQILVKNSSTNYDTSWTGATPTLVHAFNFINQSFPNLQTTTITGWTNNITTNAEQWDASTGVFTSAGPGTYIVACSVQFAASTFGGANSELSIFTTISGGLGGGVSRFFNEVSGYAGFPPTLQFTSLVRFTAAGQTMRLQVYNGIGSAVVNHNNGTSITIQQVATSTIN
jgi:hypothetical protein